MSSIRRKLSNRNWKIRIHVCVNKRECDLILRASAFLDQLDPRPAVDWQKIPAGTPKSALRAGQRGGRNRQSVSKRSATLRICASAFPLLRRSRKSSKILVLGKQRSRTDSFFFFFFRILNIFALLLRSYLYRAFIDREGNVVCLRVEKK